MALFEADSQKIQTLGRGAASAAMVHQLMQRRALTTIQKAASDLTLSEPTINSALSNLERLGIVKEITGKQRRRVYSYEAYLEILTKGTEPRSDEAKDA